MVVVSAVVGFCGLRPCLNVNCNKFRSLGGSGARGNSIFL